MRLGTIGRLIARTAVVVALSGVVVGDAPAVPELHGVLDGQMFADLPVDGVALPPMLPNALRPPAVSPPIAGRGGADPVEHAAPARLVIVRTGAIDFVSAGVVVHRVTGDGRAVSLATLAAAAPRSWITIAGDTARLGAAVQLTAGTRLDVDGVPRVSQSRALVVGGWAGGHAVCSMSVPCFASAPSRTSTTATFP